MLNKNKFEYYFTELIFSEWSSSIRAGHEVGYGVKLKTFCLILWTLHTLFYSRSLYSALK